MKNIKKSTITLFISIMAFALTSAFTLTPDNVNYVDPECTCCTCTSDGPCMEASFCGMDICSGDCELEGKLCGPDPECQPVE